MSHQPYETWIFDPPEPGSEKDGELQAHLNDCTDCASLYHSWVGVQSLIRQEVEVSPPAGFTKRWMEDLPARKARQRRRQIRRALLWLGGSIFLLSLALLAYYFATMTPADISKAVVKFFVNTGQTLTGIRIIFEWILRVTPPAVAAGVSALLAGWVLLLIFTWAVIVHRLTRKGVVTS